MPLHARRLVLDFVANPRSVLAADGSVSHVVYDYPECGPNGMSWTWLMNSSRAGVPGFVALQETMVASGVDKVRARSALPARKLDGGRDPVYGYANLVV
jgi:hypothetical protein